MHFFSIHSCYTDALASRSCVFCIDALIVSSLDVALQWTDELYCKYPLKTYYAGWMDEHFFELAY